MQVKMTSGDHIATFRLYDTVAAKQFYDQLPLSLDLTNFRDAQWMFYPPEKLNVADREAYHDGKRGELSYYAPWGDVFMLYRDFYAGDEMHRLGINLTGIGEIAKMSGKVKIEKQEAHTSERQKTMVITVFSKDKATVFQLNGSTAAKALYAQLPLDIMVENYGSNEKIFYPPGKLDISDTPLAKAKAGTLAYYAPWGDVVMFYDRFGSANGLYELGHAISGSSFIKEMSGKIRVEKTPEQSR
ncbi:MAG TPA: hypothetical protein DHV36_05970 [Desulfobacteraceae bacterium]|nr:hypothetical protein [Desulfobacteraceae bacterium]